MITVIVALRKGFRFMMQLFELCLVAFINPVIRLVLEKLHYVIYAIPGVSEESLTHQLKDLCMQHATGKLVLVLCDSTSFNIDNNKNRINALQQHREIRR